MYQANIANKVIETVADDGDWETEILDIGKSVPLLLNTEKSINEITDVQKRLIVNSK